MKLRIPHKEGDFTNWANINLSRILLHWGIVSWLDIRDLHSGEDRIHCVPGP